MAKTVLITGCSSGIGLLAARLFAARGWNVAATARHPETLATAARGGSCARRRVIKGGTMSRTSQGTCE